MLRMRGHVSADFFFAVSSYSCKVNTNFDYTSKSIKICYLFKQFTLRTCNNMTKNIVFTLQE